MREYSLTRETAESKIYIKVNLDEYQKSNISTPINFLNHMLDIFSFHSRINLTIKAESFDNDPHHIIEDIAIVLGTALNNALGTKKGIKRFGSSIMPMDEALVMSSVDISGRPYSNFDVDFRNGMINDFPSDLFRHFFYSLASTFLITVHIKKLNGFDDHHVIEAAFKSLAHTLYDAWSISDKYSTETPSSKGVL